MKNSILTLAFFVITLISSLQLTGQNFKGLDILSLIVLLDKGSMPSLKPFVTLELSTIFNLL